MCKICKNCGQSNFGIILTKMEERAGRMVNGIITEYFQGSLETKEETLINYCFTCCKEVAEQDLIETHICNVCKSDVDKVNENGVCIKCAEEVKKLSEASREDLILMILKQNKEISSKLSKSCEPAKENKIVNENKEEKNKEKPVKNIKKSDTIKKGYKSNKNPDSIKVEIDVKNNLSKTRTRKKKYKSNDKFIIQKKENRNPKKEIALFSQENMDRAINDNKEKVKSVPKIKSADSDSLDYITDKVSSDIKNVKDIAVDFNIKEDIDIYNIDTETANSDIYNIDTVTADSDVIVNTLIEIENIIDNMNNEDYMSTYKIL